ncbi:unnamed protein product [Thlaspi arvense]|uniref:AT-hook motif nuclear-localized protein n=1 Tax=Thlaspi arvense TaxID=13288 RepID=A0AAU9SP59_THLAR|nr:unnamed protein product [Thlaspi arvense]
MTDGNFKNQNIQMEEREGINGNSNPNNIITTSFGLKPQHDGPPPPPAPAPAPVPGGIVFQMDPPRSQNPNPFSAGLATNNTVASSSAAVAKPSQNAALSPPFSLTMQVQNSSSQLKKKRGRPRKYNTDGTRNVTPLSPMPISSSVPLATEFAPQRRERGRGRGRGRRGGRAVRGRGESSNSSNWLKRPQTVEFDNTPAPAPPVVATPEVPKECLIPHVLIVNAGEDVTMKIMALSQHGTRAICILSANGPISNVTLVNSTSSGGTLTYEGHYEILSLSGSFVPSESGGTRSRSGGMSVSLAAPDGRVFGGALAGLFIAAVDDPRTRYGMNKTIVLPAPPAPVSAPPVSLSNVPSNNSVPPEFNCFP